MPKPDIEGSKMALLGQIVRHAEGGQLDLTQVETETLRWAHDVLASLLEQRRNPDGGD